MANEYLKRQPTSTGNRKVFTWSGWVKTTKESKSGNGNDIFFCASSNDTGSTVYHRTRIGKYVQTEHDFGFNHYDGANDNYASEADFRDFSSWSHYFCAVDTTKEQTNDRVKIYVNGARISDLETVTAINQNLDTFINGLTVHYIGADGWTTTPNIIAKLSMFDVFLVDGQALTPDVFGFYKDGKGYQSSGTANATDFKPGQWMPHAPSKIKKDINRRGGFGVNGFYLPMNDSSNPGADFHCAPNSIIKLKGEDLPQPRNGAPTTSDAYVSQLRSDPFAANLVLAVPGISTATGANLITSGDFSSSTGWTLGTGWTISGGKLNKTTSDNNSAYYTATGLTVGKAYTFSIDVDTVGGSGTMYFYALGVYTTNPSLTTTGTHSISVIANSTSLDFGITGVSGNGSVLDNAVLKQEDAPRDYSADIRGSGTNKTPTLSGTSGIGYKLGGYYGSAMTFPGTYNHNIPLGANTDFAFGTGDFTVEMWFYTNQIARQRILSSTQGGFVSTTWVLRTEPTNTLAFYSNNTINSSVVAAANQWHHVAVTREGLLTSLYLNGVCIGIDTNDNKNYTEAGSNNFWLSSGYTVNSATENFDGEIQDLRIYKGVAKYKSGFDVPKPYTPVGIEAFRTTTDTCKNNFCTMNPLIGATPRTGSVNSTIVNYTDGNLTTRNNASPAWAPQMQSHSSFGMTTGKWYWECSNFSTTNNEIFGISKGNEQGSPTGGGTGIESLISYNDGNIYIGGQSDNGGAIPPATGTISNSPGIALVNTNDVYGFAFDVDNSSLSVYRNGILNNTVTNIVPTTRSANKPWRVTKATYSSSGSSGMTWNFGQNPSFSGTTTAGTNTDSNGKGLFKYAPPTGFLALCEDNLPAPAIADPGEHFKTVLYTGALTAGGGRSVSGVGFKPDLIWIKNRSRSGTSGDGYSDHALFDSVRGYDSWLASNTTNAENTNSPTMRLTGVHEDGFSVGYYYVTGYNGDDYVAWCWKAGGAAVTNNEGSITAQVSANPTAGFSIATYSGGSGTVGHGLGKKPSLIIEKKRGTTGDWLVTTDVIDGSMDYLRLNLTTTASSAVIAAPTSTVFTPNIGSSTVVAYCWAEIEGYSKFGSYVGNASTDGPFVYCGFKPAWVMIKASSGTTNGWVIMDNARKSVNPNGETIFANSSDTEYTDLSLRAMDFLSNGFKIRAGSGTERNANNATYIFMAFAESPFQTANAK